MKERKEGNKGEKLKEEREREEKWKTKMVRREGREIRRQ